MLLMQPYQFYLAYERTWQEKRMVGRRKYLKITLSCTVASCGGRIFWRLV
jgi:hypothetical protein